MAEVRVFGDSDKLADALAATTVRALREAVRYHEEATWVMAGGRVPQVAYGIMCSVQQPVAWERVNVAIGDERMVGDGRPDLNWNAALGLLDAVGVPVKRRLRPANQLTAEAAAADYERQLEGLPRGASGLPRLDLVWLGMGEDGHTLSLFPGREETSERERLVVPVHDSPKPPPNRISLTLRAMAGAQRVLVVAAGAEKAEVVRRAMAGDEALPISRAVAAVEEAGGQVTWMLDKAASSSGGGPV